MANTGKTKITDELLEKSLDKLGFQKSSNVNDDNNEAKKHRNKNQEPSEEEEEFDAADGTAALDGAEKGKKKRPDPVKKAEHEEEDDEDEDDEPEEKPKKKEIKKAVAKSKDEDEESDVHKSIDELKDMVKSLAIITKAGYDLSKAQADEIADLRDQIADFGDAPVTTGRKSVSKSVDRDFQKSMDADETIEKSNDGSVVVDIDRARAQVLNMFDALSFKNNSCNNEMAKAMQLFEASGIVQPNIQKAIENEFKVKLVRRF